MGGVSSAGAAVVGLVFSSRRTLIVFSEGGGFVIFGG